MSKPPVPFNQLRFLQGKLGLLEEDLSVLGPYRKIFTDRKEELGLAVRRYFMDIPETRFILEHHQAPARFQELMGVWLERLFTENLNPDFIAYLWDSGRKHVDMNLDQRYVNLGYAVCRQFCQRLVQAHVPVGDQERVLATVHKMLDFCVLVATESLLAATSQCDVEVIRGVSHQVRNPVTVIGGNIVRLQRLAEKDTEAYRTYEAIMEENKRLERTVTDVTAYTELFESPTRFEAVCLDELLSHTLERLRLHVPTEHVRVEIALDPAYPTVLGDPKCLAALLYYLIENCFEAADRANPLVRIVSEKMEPGSMLRIKLVNTGEMPNNVPLETLFTPFFSSRPAGTGLGLPIARLAARKTYALLSLERIPEEKGTVCVVQVPLDMP